MFTIVEESYSYKHDLDKLMHVMLFLRGFFCILLLLFLLLETAIFHAIDFYHILSFRRGA